MKTEKPTPHRLLKESKKGKSYVSRDLAGLAVLVAGLVALATMTSTQALQGFYRGMAVRGFSLTPAEAAWQATRRSCGLPCRWGLPPSWRRC